MMALGYQPFSVVQDKGFKRLMKLVASYLAADTVMADMYEHLRYTMR